VLRKITLFMRASLFGETTLASSADQGRKGKDGPTFATTGRADLSSLT